MDLTVRPEVSGLTLSPPATVQIHGFFESPELTEVDASGVLLHYGVTAATDILFPAKILIDPSWGRLDGHMTGSQSVPCE